MRRTRHDEAEDDACEKPEPEPEPEPRAQQPTGGADAATVGGSALEASLEVAAQPAGGTDAAPLTPVDIVRGSFVQHDDPGTTETLATLPHRVECVASSNENLDHTVYIFKVFTPEGKQWIISKRFSDCDRLRAALVKDGNPAVKHTTNRFPPKSWNPFMPVSASVTLERKGLLQSWLNEVLELCPAVDQIPPLDEFLTADDDSLDPSLMAKLLPPAPDSPAAVAAAVVGDTGRNGGHKALPAVLTVEGAAAAEAKAQAKAQALAQVSRTAPSPAALAPHADRCGAGPVACRCSGSRLVTQRRRTWTHSSSLTTTMR